MNLGRIVAALRRQPLLADVILAVALAALAAPLVLRRRWPLVVLAVTTVHFTRYWAVGQVKWCSRPGRPRRSGRGRGHRHVRRAAVPCSPGRWGR